MRSRPVSARGWVDLTHTFGPGASASLPSIATSTAKKFKAGGRDYVLHKQDVTFGTHSGTHLDAPAHLIAGSPTVDEIPIEGLFGTGVILGIDAKPFQAITAADLQGCRPSVNKGDIVIIRTGWDEKYGTEEYGSHPYLARDAAAWLAKRRVRLLGIDAPTPEVPRSARTGGFDYPIHRELLGSGILILENVANLRRLSGRRLTIGVFPIRLKGGDGAPARVVARV